jgi:hypothetical protein
LTLEWKLCKKTNGSRSVPGGRSNPHICGLEELLASSGQVEGPTVPVFPGFHSKEQDCGQDFVSFGWLQNIGLRKSYAGLALSRPDAEIEVLIPTLSDSDVVWVLIPLMEDPDIIEYQSKLF